MRNLKGYILSMLFSLLAVLPVAAIEDTVDADSVSLDSLSISIITCTPGKDIYAKFGHTAIRVVDYTLGEDAAFNYGCFNYNSDNFIYKFVLGQTDYLLECEDFDYMKYRYYRMGNGMSEQKLNLTQEEANELLRLLVINLQPENQQYRYNWLYDNCTERARDVIEKAVNGKIEYRRKPVDMTVRQMLRGCLKDTKWAEFGIDMILGQEIDMPVDKRIQMFIPDFYRSEANEAVIVREDGTTVPLIECENDILEETNVFEETNYFLSPMFFSYMLAVISALIFVTYEIRKKRSLVTFDVILHTAQGLSGILIAFLFFFSEHPAVDSNWLVLIMNPLPLFYAGWLVFCSVKKRRNPLAYVNLAVLAAFIVIMMVCKQSFNPAMYMVVLSLLIRAVSQSWRELRIKNFELRTP